MYSHNFLNATLYLDLLLVSGSHPFKDKISLFYLLNFMCVLCVWQLEPLNEKIFGSSHPLIKMKTGGIHLIHCFNLNFMWWHMYVVCRMWISSIYSFVIFSHHPPPQQHHHIATMRRTPVQAAHHSDHPRCEHRQRWHGIFLDFQYFQMVQQW